MAKLLVVGDVHATPEEIPDCVRLIELVNKTAQEEQVDTIVFMGDLYNTHNIVRLEVMHFWRMAFVQLGEFDIAVIVGNHDYAGEGSDLHALVTHSEKVRVISDPQWVCEGVLGVPYRSRNEDFIADCKKYSGMPVVLCHQTFNGAKYENGFYCPDGVDQDDIPQNRVIAGHIHTPQSFGKVQYIGAPRWRSISDANVDRAIWVFDFDDKGTLVSSKAVSTNDTCRRILTATLTPGDALPNIDPKDDWRIALKGPKSWIDETKPLLAGKAQISSFPTRAKTAAIRESDGIGLAFRKYFEGFEPQADWASKEELFRLAQERLGV